MDPQPPNQGLTYGLNMVEVGVSKDEPNLVGADADDRLNHSGLH
jgi:hypothetical protein